MEHGCSLCQPCSKNCSKATRRHIGVIRVAHQGKTVEKHLQQNVCTMCLVHLGAGCFSGLPTLLKHRETLAVQPFAPEENCGNSTYPTLPTAASASWPLHHKLQMTLCGKKCPTMSCSRGKMVIPRNITKLVCRDTCICGSWECTAAVPARLEPTSQFTPGLLWKLWNGSGSSFDQSLANISMSCEVDNFLSSSKLPPGMGFQIMTAAVLSF